MESDFNTEIYLNLNIYATNDKIDLSDFSEAAQESIHNNWKNNPREGLSGAVEKYRIQRFNNNEAAKRSRRKFRETLVGMKNSIEKLKSECINRLSKPFESNEAVEFIGYISKELHNIK